MNIGDKIGLRNGYGDVVEFECVYVKPHPAKAEDARVSRDKYGDVWVFLNQNLRGIHFSDGASLDNYVGPPILEVDCKRDLLLTGPEAAEYVAAARENRDAVWPAKEEPLPVQGDSKECFSPTPQPELPTAESEHPLVIANRILTQWRCDEDADIADLEKAITDAIRTDRQARSGERGG